MLFLIRGTLVVLVAACSVPPQRYTPAEHEKAAAHYDAVADTVATQCWKARRHQVAVTDPDPCVEPEEVMLVTANRNAADDQRAQAAELRELQARGEPLPVKKPIWLQRPHWTPGE
jgi:hypothetical protein